MRGLEPQQLSPFSVPENSEHWYRSTNYQSGQRCVIPPRRIGGVEVEDLVGRPAYPSLIHDGTKEPVLTQGEGPLGQVTRDGEPAITSREGWVAFQQGPTGYWG
jgi:hypothetical protein